MDLKRDTATVAAGADSICTELQFQEQTNNRVHRLSERFDFFHVITFLFLTYNAVLSSYRSRGNPGDLAFVISCYGELILLFWCLKRYENLGADAPVEHKYRLKVVVWILTTLLTVMFAWRVSQIMPLCLKIVVWGMSGSVIVAGFYAFFIFSGDVKGANDYCKLGDEKHELYDSLNPEEKV
ncbi:hypothetical protein LUZ62_046095 [Rhynchospora pubera]|uniref:MARVEL domain-containing protein n=1 Tax=Rhynchospora pubera TaxID=906938 RepID=A0AAV8FPC4_9POAL|nr:hypothetical protein LUZ62_046095 [Rhynchospora pubera]